MIKSLKEIANIKFGLHAQPDEYGNVLYLQAGHFTNRGKLLQIPSTFIDVQGRLNEHLLEDGDIILAGKGNRNFAWCYHNNLGPAVPSSIFFIIQPIQKIIDPEYLTAYFNLEKSQLHFKRLGEGSNVASIRKSELGELNIPILPMKKQLEIAAIAQLHHDQIEVTEKILLSKNELYEAVINNLTSNK
jgi:restriction endonuclease S subunit